jgi:hypothetical protein
MEQLIKKSRKVIREGSWAAHHSRSVNEIHHHQDDRHDHTSCCNKEYEVFRRWYKCCSAIVAGIWTFVDIPDAFRYLDKKALPIVSPDYLNSNYCYEKEFQRALQLQADCKIIIVPVIAERCDWLNSPFREMKAVPKDGKPISDWTNDNAAFLNITSELRRVLNALNTPIPRATTGAMLTPPSKNYKVKRDFTQVDVVNFRRDSFNVIRKFFLESIDEINTVDDIQGYAVNRRKRQF